MRTSAIRAFTLIEILIVLAMLSVLGILIGAALDIHLRQMTINRTEVEEARLAHVILETIARDIRSVVVPLREEQLEVDTSMLTGVMGLDPTGELFDDFDFNWEGLEETEDVEGYDGLMFYGVMPGIYGEWNRIQIDTGRLPRGEMYGSRQIRRGTSLAADRLSASKTVLYYLGADTESLAMDPEFRPQQVMGSLGRSLDPHAPQVGLFRRQLDRQATQFAIQSGLEWEYERDDESLAPEVESIEFFYFDPTIDQLGVMGDWLDHWDMDERQMLPAAVKIVVGIRRADIGRSLLSWGQTDNRERVVEYSLIVPIPVTVNVIHSDFYGEEWFDGVDW